MEKVETLRILADSKPRTVRYIDQTVTTLWQWRYNRKASSQEVALPPDELEVQPAAYRRAICIYETTYTTWDVRRLRQSLTQNEWLLLWGSYCVGYNYKELAKLTGCRESAVGMALFRAKKKARKILGIKEKS